jgi:hypothetical protein
MRKIEDDEASGRKKGNDGDQWMKKKEKDLKYRLTTICNKIRQFNVQYFGGTMSDNPCYEAHNHFVPP